MRCHALRKTKTSDLIPILRKRSDRLPEPISIQLRALVDWIEGYTSNRHIAVHGAFHLSDTPGFLRVLYTHKVKTMGGTEFMPEENEVDRQKALNILFDADRILRTLAGLVAAIDRGEVSLR